MALDEQAEINVSDELLTTALGQRGCPICMILQKKINDLMCKLQFEAVHNQEVNALVLSAGGYCHFHFWYLDKLASPVTNAQLLEDLLGKIERECMKNTSGDETASFGDASGCPVCCFCRVWEENLLISFAGRIQEKDFYFAGKGELARRRLSLSFFHPEYRRRGLEFQAQDARAPARVCP